MTPSFEYTVPDSPYRFVIMDRNVLIKKYGTMAVLLTLLVVMNPELRAFLLMANVVGVDLMVFFIAIQVRDWLQVIPVFPHAMRTFVCVAGFATLRFATRMLVLLLAPAHRATAGLTTSLFVLSQNMWCPRTKPHVGITHGL